MTAPSAPTRDRGRARRRAGTRRDEGGLSAVEITVAMTVLVAVALIGFKATGTIFGLSTHTLDSAQSATVSGLAVRELSQETRSANVIFDPADEGANAGTNPDGTSVPAGFSLRIYTQNNGIFSCVQWRLLDTGELQVRQWSDGSTPPVWTNLLAGLVNYSPPSPFAADTKPFVLDPSSSYSTSYSGSSTTVVAGRLLDVDLLLDQHGTETPIEVKTSIAGRDAWYYAPNSGYCAVS